MEFIEYANSWLKSEVMQGKIMMAVGLILLLAFIFILRNGNELMKGTLIPISLLLIILIGYGGYILYSRPAHVKQSVELFQNSESEAIQKEKEKHISDNKAGNTLLKIYPLLAILSIMPLFFSISSHFKGMALGFAIVFIATYIIDNGFVSRSDAFLGFLNQLSEKS